MPQVDAAKMLGVRRFYPHSAWADASGRVNVVMIGRRRKPCLASFTRADLVKLARMALFTTVEMDYNEDTRPADLVDIVTRNVVPSKWLKRIGSNK